MHRHLSLTRLNCLCLTNQKSNLIPKLIFLNEWAVTIILLLGCCIGSFLNVVIHRLPTMLERQNRSSTTKETDGFRFNLAVPRSHCVTCKRSLSLFELIPILSWLALKGKCKSCQSSISPRYPLVEIVTALLTLTIIYIFGFQLKTGAILIFSWSLLALAFIDWETKLLPDQITLPLLWMGLIINLSGTITSLPSAVIGAIVGYGFLWVIYWLYKAIAKTEGIGHGDFKLLSAIGAWLGWQALPITILLSATSALIFAIIGLARGSINRGDSIPYGPFLAFSGWICLVSYSIGLQQFISIG